MQGELGCNRKFPATLSTIHKERCVWDVADTFGRRRSRTGNVELIIRVLLEIRGCHLRGPSVHSQVIGDVVVTTFDGEVDGVLACRQRRQQQIHAIFGGSSHRDAIGDAGESEEIGDDVIR